LVVIISISTVVGCSVVCARVGSVVAVGLGASEVVAEKSPHVRDQEGSML
jgi:hypothetical protein